MQTLKEIALRFANLNFISLETENLMKSVFSASEILKDLKEDIFVIVKVFLFK